MIGFVVSGADVIPRVMWWGWGPLIQRRRSVSVNCNAITVISAAFMNVDPARATGAAEPWYQVTFPLSQRIRALKSARRSPFFCISVSAVINSVDDHIPSDVWQTASRAKCPPQHHS